MIFAWLFCAGLAIIFARYYRAMWPDTKICGKPVWFIVCKIQYIYLYFVCLIPYSHTNLISTMCYFLMEN